MNAVEFIAELDGSATLAVPPGVASQLPSAGTVRVVVFTTATPDEEAEWRAASYGQFMADDAPEDAIYDSLR